MAMLNNQMVYVLYYILFIWLAQTLVFQTTNQICVALCIYICTVYFHFQATVLR